MLNEINCICLAILFTNIVGCFCYVNYEMFTGFGTPNTTQLESNADYDMVDKYSYSPTTKEAREITTAAPLPTMKIKNFKIKCPETEQPVSFGSYEVPSSRDLVLFTKRMLLKMFNSYHEKTLTLLRDIKEIVSASKETGKYCKGRHKAAYKACIKQVSRKYALITKSLATELEEKKKSVSALMEETICNIKDMDTDPLQLVKSLAMDLSLLEFALPTFLRIIGICSSQCSKQIDSKEYNQKQRPVRHMTDQELVVKHLLTKKTYLQLMKDTEADFLH